MKKIQVVALDLLVDGEPKRVEYSAPIDTADPETPICLPVYVPHEPSAECSPDRVEEEAAAWWKKVEQLQRNLSPKYASLHAYRSGACRHGAALLPVRFCQPDGSDVEVTAGSSLAWDSIAGIGIPGTGVVVGLMPSGDPCPAHVIGIWVDPNEKLQAVATQIRDLFAPANVFWGNIWPGDGLLGRGDIILLTDTIFAEGLREGRIHILPEMRALSTQQYSARRAHEARSTERALPEFPPPPPPPPPPGSTDNLQQDTGLTDQTQYWKYLAIAFAIATGVHPEPAPDRNCDNCGQPHEAGWHPAAVRRLSHGDIPEQVHIAYRIPGSPEQDFCARCACNWALGQVLLRRTETPGENP